MKSQLAINLERMDDSSDMREVARHTLEMVQMAEAGGFNIAWAYETPRSLTRFTASSLNSRLNFRLSIAHFQFH